MFSKATKMSLKGLAKVPSHMIEAQSTIDESIKIS